MSSLVPYETCRLLAKTAWIIYVTPHLGTGTFPCSPRLYAIYYKSLPSFKAILGGIPLLNHHLSCGFFGGVGCIHWQNMPTPCLRGRFLPRFWPTRCVGFVWCLRGAYASLFWGGPFFVLRRSETRVRRQMQMKTRKQTKTNLMKRILAMPLLAFSFWGRPCASDLQLVTGASPIRNLASVGLVVASLAARGAASQVRLLDLALGQWIPKACHQTKILCAMSLTSPHRLRQGLLFPPSNVAEQWEVHRWTFCSGCANSLAHVQQAGSRSLSPGSRGIERMCVDEVYALQGRTFVCETLGHPGLC